MPETILPDQASGDQPERPRPRRRDVRSAAYSDEHWLGGPELRALATAVRETRARRRLSQEELGFRAGMHRNYVGAIERAEINPTFRILLKLCRGLAVPASELILLYEKRRPEPADEPPAPHGHMTGRRNSAPPRSVKAAGSRLKAQRTGPSPTGQPPAPASSSAEPPHPTRRSRHTPRQQR